MRKQKLIPHKLRLAASLSVCSILCASAGLLSVKALEASGPQKISLQLSVKDEEYVRDGTCFVELENPVPGGEYELSFDGGTTWTVMPGSSVTYTSLPAGQYSLIVREKSSQAAPSDVQPVTVRPARVPDSICLGIPALLQNPELPTGCEITSLTMLLNGLGFGVSKEMMADAYLPKGEMELGNFHEVFVGNPRDPQALGCYAPVIVSAANRFLQEQGTSVQAKNITGTPFEDLSKYLARHVPVLVWTTMELGDPRPGKSWEDPSTGQVLQWTAGEHCVVLLGYSRQENLVYVNDPRVGFCAYPADKMALRYQQMGSQAVVLQTVQLRSI